jgi:hypothetical protein
MPGYSDGVTGEVFASDLLRRLADQRSSCN